MTTITEQARKLQYVRAACSTSGFNEQLTDRLITLYSEKHRKYHNLDHIYDLLLIATRDYHFNHPINNTILFHDIVYYPNSKFNEELSAAAYADWSRNGTYDSESYVAILASKNHTSKEHADKSDWVKDFLDYDLYGLATDQYRANAQKIWQEFEPFVEASDFINGRAKFLHTMLESDRIYWNHPEWEAAARANMHEELTYLREDHYSISYGTSISDVEYTYGTEL